MPLQLVSEGTAVTPPANVRLELFPSPVLVWRWFTAETHKNALIEAIDRRRESLRVGWRSSDYLSTWPEPAVQTLTRWVAERVQEASFSWHEGIEAKTSAPWRVSGWADAIPAVGVTPIRCLANGEWNWSAYYCLDTCGSSSALLFEDRDNGIDFSGNHYRRSRRCAVMEGHLVTFPAWLHHRIEPHLFGGEHIWIGFNLRNVALEAPRMRETVTPKWSLPAFLGKLFGRHIGRASDNDAMPAGVNIEI